MNIDCYPEVKLADLSKLTYSYHLGILPGRTAVKALIIRFVGPYGVGSKGNGDADFMRAVASAGLDAWTPGALVFDFRELDYVWGDMLSTVLGVGKGKANVLELLMLGQISDVEPRDIPTAVVVSERCRAAVTSLLVQEMRKDPAKWLFESVEAALAGIPT